MTFRGDYTPPVHKHIQKLVWMNDPAAFQKAISDKSIFARIDRNDDS